MDGQRTTIRSNLMPVEWSGLSPELLLRLDRTRPGPLHTQLEGGLRDAIRSGRLKPGERLPSSRELARHLGVSRGLVQDCFSQLYAGGYLSARVPDISAASAPLSPIPNTLVICAGFAQGLPLALGALAGRSARRVAFEDPGYGGRRNAGRRSPRRVGGRPRAGQPWRHRRRRPRRDRCPGWSLSHPPTSGRPAW